MKSGFTLLEVAIGIFLASMLAISLFQSVGSTRKTIQMADEVMDLDMRIAIFHHQFQKDFAGIFVPEEPVKQKQPANGKEKEDQTKAPQKPPAPTEKIKFPEKLFYSVNKDEQLDQLTFITTNPVRVYEKAANVLVKPRMVRIVYRLEQDTARKDSYNLYRQESEKLDLKAFGAKTDKKIRSYELLGNIKKISLDFSYPVKKEEKKEEPQPGDQKQPTTEIEKIVKRIDWPFATAKEAKEQKAPPYPESIAVQLEIWDNSHTETRSITLTYPIASFSLWPRQKRKKKKPVAKPPRRKSTALKPETEQKLAQMGEKMMAIFTKSEKKVRS